MDYKLKVNIRLFGNNDDLKAFADVTLRVKFGEITIKRFKVLQGKTRPWVAFPQIQYYNLFSPKYAGLLHMNKRVEEYIKNQILKAYHNAIKKKNT